MYEVITTFNKLIFEKFKISITKYSTSSSIAFAIYQSNFLKEEFRIPIITHMETFKFFKNGYTGGAVDVYKPSSQSKKIFRYDVNSLYPSVMAEYTMPTGNYYYFEGDIFNILQDKSIIGIFEAEIEAPNINIPILQTRIKTLVGSSTVAPIGKWVGIYEARELLNAEKHGYKFKIKRGYVFEKYVNIFKEYVDFIYEIKKNNKRGTPLFKISKLLLNSLYGRFGMSPEKPKHLIISNVDSDSYLISKKVLEVIDLKNDSSLISYYEDDSSITDNEYNINVSIPIALTITALARVKMSVFKTLPGFLLHYSDTDNVDLDKPLPEKYIGVGLGEMKPEGVYDTAIYIAPKMYFLKNKDEEISVVKGLSIPLNQESFESLLKQGSTVKLTQEKWKRDLGEGEIKVEELVHTLAITDNKRNVVYDNGVFCDTTPICINTIEKSIVV